MILLTKDELIILISNCNTGDIKKYIETYLEERDMAPLLKQLQSEMITITDIEWEFDHPFVVLDKEWAEKFLNGGNMTYYGESAEDRLKQEERNLYYETTTFEERELDRLWYVLEIFLQILFKFLNKGEN